jgi:excisionase family DNA binding protein
MMHLMQKMHPTQEMQTDEHTMATLLTTRDVQALIKVDKSTIYRMAESGRIPAIKVGRQWRFPEDELMAWLDVHRSAVVRAPDGPESPEGDSPRGDLRSILPPNTIQALADLLGDVFECMVIITDMEGRPLTEVANPCGYFNAVASTPDALDRCIEDWRGFAEDSDLSPRFRSSHLGFLCSRGFIRTGANLRGMVIVGGIAPDQWPPSEEEIERVAAELGFPPAPLMEHIDEVFHHDLAHRDWILALLPQVGTLIANLASERGQLVTKLEAIASLAGTQRSES